jgi:uncharacterized ubiquitin-like protein YukD
MKFSAFLFSLFLVLSGPEASFASSGPREIKAVRTTQPPVIDGTLRDPLWQTAHVATGFHQYEPHNDRQASFNTEVKVLYDDGSVYIAVRMFDPAPDSILQEMGLRNAGDNLNADRFYVDINPFNDGINGFRFQVSASGVQTDSNLSGGGSRGDTNWDAVWISKHNITDDGWIVEMEIPYSALRFPKGEIQTWGINFWREIRRKRELSSWNFVNRRIGDPVASMGQMNGISDIKPPPRIALYPYLSNYIEKNGHDRGWGNSFNGGMDLKLGISPSFTMDVTLIPDFGQVQSDAKVLNLSPFEIKYDENRQFFTEGTELFEKADIFYSRRIGARPVNYEQASEQLEANEFIYENPMETRLINASKISGRTSSGLGIGLFNAMTAASEATIKDTISGNIRTVHTQDFTNYNLVVIDQSLKNNSFVSLINTNVAGAEKGYTSNVTGTEFRIMDQSNMFRISGEGAVSQHYLANSDNRYGFKYDIRAGKFGGTWQYDYSREVISNTYDQNDMGFLRRNNRVSNEFSLSHNIFDPFWRLWTLTNSFSIEHTSLYEPKQFTDLELEYSLRALFDTRFFIMLNTSYLPAGERDYFEPRTPGRFYRTDNAWDTRLTLSSDYRKRIYFDGNISFGRLNADEPQNEFGFTLQPTFRVNDKFNLAYRLEYNKMTNDIGYVTQLNADSVFFGRRQSPTTVNTFRTTYMLSNKLSVNFNMRHYWSRVDYDGQYYFLQQNGRLHPVTDNLDINDINYNAFTIDMMITWHFAPGSQMTIAWKNIIDSKGSFLYNDYFENLDVILRQPQINSLSIRVLYYIDYLSVQRLLQK